MNDLRMVDTSDPAAVCREVRQVYSALYGEDDGFVSRAFDWFVEAFGGGYRDYQAVDMAYHDREHTMQGTLCFARLIRCRQETGANPQIPEKFFRLGLLSILLHDSGYLKHADDTSGTGAKYTLDHVDRSRAFAGQMLTDHGFGAEDVTKVQRMISCTGLNVDLDSIDFQTRLEKIVGLSVATSDLLGQMAARDYVDRLADLYKEFTECWEHAGARAESLHYENVASLLEKTPAFWQNYVKHKLDTECLGLYKFLNHPHPDGPNDYLMHIEANIDRVREINDRRHSAKLTNLQKSASYCY
ncbi:hypothetical protein ACFL1S_03980 [Pseudomonadota bacterium]